MISGIWGLGAGGGNHHVSEVVSSTIPFIAVNKAVPVGVFIGNHGAIFAS
jgi:hypothetical protein